MENNDRTLLQYQKQNEELNRKIEKFTSMSYEDKLEEVRSKIGGGTDFDLLNMIEEDNIPESMLIQKELKIIIEEMEKKAKEQPGQSILEASLECYKDISKVCDKWLHLKEQNNNLIPEEKNEILTQIGEIYGNTTENYKCIGLRERKGFDTNSKPRELTKEEKEEAAAINDEVEKFKKLPIKEKIKEIDELLFSDEYYNTQDEFIDILETKDRSGMEDLKIAQKEIEIYKAEYEKLPEEEKRNLTSPEYHEKIIDMGELYNRTINLKEKYGELLIEERSYLAMINNNIIRREEEANKIKKIKKQNQEKGMDIGTNKENDNKSVAQNSAFSNIFKGFTGISTLGIAKGMNQYVNNYKSEINTYIDKVRKDKNSKEETTILAKTNYKDNKTKDTDQDRV